MMHAMHLSSLVTMLESGLADRTLLDGTRRLTGADIGGLVRNGAVTAAGRSAVVYAGENHPELPIALLSAAWAGVPFVPVNYRLDDAQLNRLVDRYPDAVVLADEATAPRLEADGVRLLDDWLADLAVTDPGGEPAADDDDVALVLFTSGTTAEPKAALLRHRHLMAYLLCSVEFASAAEDDATLVSVPPYHIAGIANMLSNLFAGRRLVYLRSFDPEVWLQTVRDERITHAMVVPTMLARIVTTLGGRPAQADTLRSLSYGGAKLSERVLTEALLAFPTTGFVNAYGLTETASTIAILDPDDHRAAITSERADVRRRLASVGHVLPTVEVDIRGDNGESMAPGEPGLIHLRGEQVAGESVSYTHLTLPTSDLV